MSRKLEGGFSLLEVLIAMLILSIGLLGIAGLQIKGQQYNHVSYLRTQAIFLAYDIMDRMRVNSYYYLDPALPILPDDPTNPNPKLGPVQDGSYAMTPTSLPTMTTDCDTATCDSHELAIFDLVSWNALVHENLRNPRVTIERFPTTTKPVEEYTIIIEWKSITQPGTYDKQEWKFTP